MFSILLFQLAVIRRVYLFGSCFCCGFVLSLPQIEDLELQWQPEEETSVCAGMWQYACVCVGEITGEWAWSTKCVTVVFKLFMFGGRFDICSLTLLTCTVPSGNHTFPVAAKKLLHTVRPELWVWHVFIWTCESQQHLMYQLNIFFLHPIIHKMPWNPPKLVSLIKQIKVLL